MFLKKLLIAFIVSCSAVECCAQSCTTLGQTPATAFPVCGSDTFNQKSVPTCANGFIPVPCPANGNVYQDVNPFWYKFTCFQSGTLGLTIKPKDLGDDYDWQIFDVTGHNPNDVYSISSLLVGCNWSGLTGITGTSPSAISLTECGSLRNPNVDPPIFSKMPQLIQGHNYLLLISHFSGNNQSGYGLSFGGGTASITDTVPPALLLATVSCDGQHVSVVLNKKMKCSSVAADGSDFNLSPAVATVVSASGNGCRIGFDVDTITLTLSGAVTPGPYTVTANLGTDGNTLLDNCDAQVPVGSAVGFSFEPTQPTPLDSIAPPGCAPQVLRLVFRKRIKCASIAPDGSDFKVTGPTAVTVTGAGGLCDGDAESSVVLVQLAAPIQTAGHYQITLDVGSDGNTIVDECGHITPVSQTIDFFTSDTVSAAFTDQVLYGCKKDTIRFTYLEKNGVDQWQWVFDGKDTVKSQDPTEIYSVFDDKTVQLIVSNGVCRDTVKTDILLDNAISVDFEAPNLMCPKDEAIFKNNSTGNILHWNWDFGDGTGSSMQFPTGHLYPLVGAEKIYTVSLVIRDRLGCQDTAIEHVDVLKSCYIAVPSAFTPNGDGVNDFLYPLNALKADNLQFRVYNRFGQEVFETQDWTKKWDGKLGGQDQPAGAYVWTLQYTDHDTGKKFFLKGTSILIR